MDKLTHTQALAVMGFTGIATVRFDFFHKDVEHRLGRPVWTHQFADKSVREEVKAAYRDDFMAMLPEWGVAPDDAARTKEST